MKGKAKTVFPGNNSSRGFYSYYESGLSGMERIYILKGGPGTGKSSLMRRLGEAFLTRGFDVEFWQCSSDNDSLDGILVPVLKAAMIDGTAPHIVDPRYPGVREEILHLGEYWDPQVLSRGREKIVALTDEISAAFAMAYRRLGAAGSWDLQLQQERGTQTKVPTGAGEFVAEVLGEDGFSLRHLFASAVTPAGIVDLTFDLCRECKTRYFLLGKRGLGQRAYMEQLVAGAVERRRDVEIYHGCLHADEVVLVIFPKLELSVAAVETFPEEERRSDDHVLDFSGEETKTMQIAEGKRDTLIAAGVEEIARAHKLHDALESYYIEAMDFSALDEIGGKILQEVLKES